MTEAKRPIDPARHAQDRNFIESILKYIPGFRGYLQKEYRRDSDHLARMWMADKLKACKRSVDGFLQTLVAEAKLDELPQFERVRTRLDGLESKMRGDVRGYSGFFDFVRVDEGRLDAVYELDMSLIEKVQSLSEWTAGLAEQNETARSLAGSLLRQVEELESAYARRGEILKGLAE